MSSSASSVRSLPAPPGQVVGLKPWFPWPLSRWRWLNEPVRAERLAALRIGLGLLTLFDVLFTFLPVATEILGRDSILGYGMVRDNFKDTERWSLLTKVED